MIPIVNWNENPVDFPQVSVDMRAADSGELRQRIRDACRASTVSYVGRGFNNAHHLVRGGAGGPIVVRRMLAPVPALERRLENECSTLATLTRLGFAWAPKAIRKFTIGTIDESPAYAMSFVDGDELRFDDATIAELGAVVGRLHDLRVPAEFDHGIVASDQIVERLLARVSSNFTVVAHTMEPIVRRPAARLLGDLERSLPKLAWPSGQEVIVHGDLGEHNSLRSADGIMLIDWEFCGVADPLFDLMWLFAREGFDVTARDAFLRGYGRTLTKDDRHRLGWLRRLALFELVVWAQSGLDDLEHGRNQTFFTAADGPFLRRQVARIDDLEM